MMKVYIIAASDNISFAEKLLNNIRNVKIITRLSVDGIGLGNNVALKRKMENADVILVINFLIVCTLIWNYSWHKC